MFYYCVGLFLFVQYSFASNFDKYRNLRCKDNGNEPVDWWFIYKPPLSDWPHFREGGNFTFLRELDQRWQQSEYYIYFDSMLQHTLQPLSESQRGDIAWLVNSGQPGHLPSEGSSSYVVMMADEVSGIWLGHSIPGFPDVHASLPSVKFPEEELKNGHYLVCLSLDLPTLNMLASVLKETNPVVEIHVPSHLEDKLLFWKYFNRLDMRHLMRFSSDAMSFTTKDSTLPMHIMIRRPNDKKCLYKRFAEQKKVILDVYGHDKYWTKNFCTVSFGIRRLNSISLKFAEEVHYIRNTSEKFSFGVTTAAHWQRTGSEPNQYWACLSTLEREESLLKGGVILCANAYKVWWSFDNLKVNEPDC